MKGTIIANSNSRLKIQTVDVDGQSLRVGTRSAKAGAPRLLICNGLGANLELARPLIDELRDIEVVIFDVPGVGGSALPRLPYRFSDLTRMADRLLTKLKYDGPVDVLGISWGGALAQQFAHDYPQRCRRLILASTSAGAIMVPGKLSVLAKLINPRRYVDPAFLRNVGAALYGGQFRREPELLRAHGRNIRAPLGRGYFYQLLAGWGWTSVLWLPCLRQPTLVMAGSDDPIVPLINARFLAAMIRDSRLHIVDDGHLFLITSANKTAPTVLAFLGTKAA